MHRILNVRTFIDACDCTRGLYGHPKRFCTQNGLWERNPLPNGEPFNLPQRRDGPMLNQLSYIPKISFSFSGSSKFEVPFYHATIEISLPAFDSSLPRGL